MTSTPQKQKVYCISTRDVSSAKFLGKLTCDAESLYMKRKCRGKAPLAFLLSEAQLTTYVYCWSLLYN